MRHSHRWVRGGWHVAAVALCLLANPVMACSIPVFRYALERWPADLFTATVDVPAASPPQVKDALHWLEDQAQPNGGPMNLIVERRQAGDPAAETPAAEGKRASLVISRAVRGSQPTTIWSGACEEARAVLAAGPWRDELVRRLVEGDAVVWLVLAGADPAAAKHAVAVLDQELPQLAEDTPLPRGIGLPGSELLAAVPLEVRFSVLSVPAEAQGAELLRATLLAGRSENADGVDSSSPQETVVVPVFGRGRAAAVLSASKLTGDVVAELTAFLCGACSCQVKQFNPGFDLLLPVDWDQALYGEGLEAVPAPVAAPPLRQPQLVPIPAGRRSTSTNRLEPSP